jgi:hypothetical protein
LPAISSPFGVVPINHPSGTARPRVIANGIPSAYGTAIRWGQPVLLSTAGQIQPVLANNVDFCGVFGGCQFTDTLGRFRVSNFWPAGQTYLGDFACFVDGFDDPDLIYEVQANGVVPQTALGDQANLINFADGATPPGFSQCMVDAAALAGVGVQGQLAIVDKGLQVNNDWGDAFTILRVKIARHQFRANKTAI